MRRAALWAVLAACTAFALVVASGRGTTMTDGELANAIGSELRCPVCQGLSIADSDSATATDLRADIARRIDAGESRDSIIDAYVARYGEWIRLRPPRSGLAVLVWVVPPFVAALAAMALVLALWRWRSQPKRAASAADLALVEQALADVHRESLNSQRGDAAR